MNEPSDDFTQRQFEDLKQSEFYRRISPELRAKVDRLCRPPQYPPKVIGRPLWRTEDLKPAPAAALPAEEPPKYRLAGLTRVLAGPDGWSFAAWVEIKPDPAQ